MKMNHQKANKETIDYIVGAVSIVYPLDDQVKEELYKHAFSVNLEKGDTLFKQGDTCQYIYFIMKGALMSYTQHNKKTIITYISVENNFVSSISGFLGKAPSRESVVAAEPVWLIGVRNEVILKLFESSFSLNYIFRLMIEQYYKDAEERAHIVRLGNARERYLYFKQMKPGYIERLPSEYIAGMLSMNTETFLRIKKQEEDGVQKKMFDDNFRIQLDKYVIESECFKNCNITTAHLAQQLSIPTHRFSQLLNDSFEINFKTFINNYRIDYVKERLSKSKDWYSYTIEALAIESGFSSRSTFYNAFKKTVGMTPIEFIQVANKLSSF